MRFARVLPLTLLLVVAWSVTAAFAQPLGTFRWQTQPYCNILTIQVVQQAGLYLLDGTDDQCGAPEQASIVGLAFQNPSGSIGFGLTIVTAPSGAPAHISATISAATLGGTWRDSAGNSGTLIFTPGAGTGGPPRPVPPGVLRAVDQNNQEVGTVLDENRVVRMINGHLTEVCASIAGLCSQAFVLAYVTPDCSGQPYRSPQLMYVLSIVAGSLTNTYLYGGTSAQRTHLSQRSIDNNGTVSSCMATNQTFQSVPVLPYDATLELGGLVPPFRVVQ